MEVKKIINIIGALLGIVIVITGIVFVSNPALSFYTESADDVSFGGDFYTYQYKATKEAVHNTAVTANNIRELGEKIAGYAGTAFIFGGILCIIHFAKEFACCCVEAPAPKAKTPVSDSPYNAQGAYIPYEQRHTESPASGSAEGENNDEVCQKTEEEPVAAVDEGDGFIRCSHCMRKQKAGEYCVFCGEKTNFVN